MKFHPNTIQKLALNVLLIPMLAQFGVCGDSPGTMTHAAVQMSGSDIPANSFFNKAKTFWRASNQYCRVDEEPDPEHGIHGRMVVNEPDAWMINLADKTAKHVVDQGPSFNCRLPIFAFDEEMAKSKIGGLEIGREIEFFQSNGAKLVDGPKLEFEVKYYRLQLDEYTLTLAERVDNHAPIMLGLIRGDKAYKARYLLWEQLPFKEDLFAKPTGLKIEELR